jgi:hypothetical protein
MVYLNKPAQCREAPITDKTGSGNNEASVVERMVAQTPMLISVSIGNVSN